MVLTLFFIAFLIWIFVFDGDIGGCLSAFAILALVGFVLFFMGVDWLDSVL